MNCVNDSNDNFAVWRFRLGLNMDSIIDNRLNVNFVHRMTQFIIHSISYKINLNDVHLYCMNFY